MSAIKDNTVSFYFPDLNAGNSLEIQEKLERLNQIMSKDWQRIDPTRRMFLSQSKALPIKNTFQQILSHRISHETQMLKIDVSKLW